MTVDLAEPGATPAPPPHLAYPLRRRVAAFLVIFVGEFFFSWAWNTVDVLRPQLRETLDLTLTQAGSAYSTQGIGALLGAVVFGQLADQFGRRAILPIVMFGFGTLLLASLLVESYLQLLAQRMILGFFLGGMFPVIVGIYVDLFDQSVRGRLAAFMLAVFSLSLVAMGWTLSFIPDGQWKLMFWIGGVPPLVLALLAYPIVPALPVTKRTAGSALPITELFAHGFRRLTIMLTLMCGLNFFAYQAFNGWMTVYLKEVRNLTAADAGSIVAWQFTGYTIGAFVWGWIADRYGRKRAAGGFGLAAVGVVVFLAIESRIGLSGVGFLYGLGLSCSVIWGPWIAELYPAHLRSTAVSIFHWGRIVSFVAPLITGAVADAVGLGWAMLTASAVFIAAACIWLSLPETLRVRKTA